MMKIGTPVQLEASAEGERQFFRTSILDQAKGKIYIDYPIEEATGKVRFFLEGSEFQATFIGTDEAVYSFSTEVTGRLKTHVPMLVLKDPGKEEYSRIQRREFVRVEASLDAAVHSPDGLFPPFTAVTADVSGGGAALALKEGHPLEALTEVDVWLSVPYRSGEIQYLCFKASVIRISSSEGRTRAHVKFEEADEQVRQKLIRYIFEKQQEDKERGIV
ncbi:flagellar brake protein [Alkalicoccus urumqiensis]|nr:flagellar brake domain-containing protein [Alkalicoccus urumqiensis]